MVVGMLGAYPGLINQLRATGFRLFPGNHRAAAAVASVMPRFFTRLRTGSAFHTAEPCAEGFVIRPAPGCQREFDRLADLVLSRCGARYVVLPQTNGARGWASLTIISLQ